MLKTALAAAAVAAASWTARLAGEVSDDQVTALQIGTTTYHQILAQFGKPTTVENASDGKTLVYIATHTHVKAATFVPIVGLFAGGAKAQAHTARREFGADGLLRKESTTDTEINCRTFGGCK